MNKFASLAIVLFGCTVLSAQPTADTTQAIVQSYLEIQTHLAADKFAEIKTPARALVKQARAIDKAGQPIAKSAAALESAADINAARDAFGPLSDAVVAFVRAHGSPEVAANLRLGYCPMVKQSWVQREPQVRNPYYGSAMLTCGELKPLKK